MNPEFNRVVIFARSSSEKPAFLRLVFGFFKSISSCATFRSPQTAVTTKNLYGTDYGIRMLQESAHRQLYVFANTSGVGLEMQEGNTWKLVVGGANAILILGMALSIIFLVIPGFRGKKGEKKNEETVNS